MLTQRLRVDHVFGVFYHWAKTSRPERVSAYAVQVGMLIFNPHFNKSYVSACTYNSFCKGMVSRQKTLLLNESLQYITPNTDSKHTYSIIKHILGECRALGSKKIFQARKLDPEAYGYFWGAGFPKHVGLQVTKRKSVGL